MAAYELSKYKPELSSLEVGFDTKEQNVTIAERDDETLARLGKKPVLKVCIAEDSIIDVLRTIFAAVRVED
jgi:hypothetical protein